MDFYYKTNNVNFKTVPLYLRRTVPFLLAIHREKNRFLQKICNHLENYNHQVHSETFVLILNVFLRQSIQ